MLFIIYLTIVFINIKIFIIKDRYCNVSNKISFMKIFISKFYKNYYIYLKLYTSKYILYSI